MVPKPSTPARKLLAGYPASQHTCEQHGLQRESITKYRGEPIRTRFLRGCDRRAQRLPVAKGLETGEIGKRHPALDIHADLVERPRIEVNHSPRPVAIE